jgi:hypothetical protein
MKKIGTVLTDSNHDLCYGNFSGYTEIFLRIQGKNFEAVGLQRRQQGKCFVF